MHIESAFCVELAEVINIYQAQEYFFRRPVPRERFTFLCSNRECRERNRTKVTGVNYDKLIEEADKYLKPHFRKNSEHIATCEWVEIGQALRELEEEEAVTPALDAHLRPRGNKKNLKSADVIDIFAPAAAGKGEDGTDCSSMIVSEHGRATGTQGNAHITKTSLSIIRCLPTQLERVAAYKKYLRENPTQTSMLHNVVSCYEALDGEEKRSTYLTISGCARRTYYDCFKPVSKYVLGRDTDHIYYGGAVVESVGRNYKIIFMDWPVVDGCKRRLSFYLTRDQLQEYKQRAYLGAMLDMLADSDLLYAKCYFYGRVATVEVVPRRREIAIAHLDNLVVIKKSKPQK